MRAFFADIRRSGFHIGASKGQLPKGMVAALSQFSPGRPLKKEVVVGSLGLAGQMSKTRDSNAAWDCAKHQVAWEHLERLIAARRVGKR